MEYRKVISFGGNSHVISLPKKWLDANSLKKGDLIALEENRGEIILSSSTHSGKKEPKSIEISAENKNVDLLKAEIVAAYLNNYDTIEIFSDNLKAKVLEIKSIVRNLAGLEIMLHTTKRIVAKDLLNPSEASIKSIIRRMDYITRVMVEDTTECIDGIDHYEDINQRDMDVNRLYFLVIRVTRNAYKNPSMMKEYKTNSWELLMERNIATKIEKVADHQKRIARYIKALRLNTITRDELKKIHIAIKSSYLKAMDAYYKKDKTLAFEMNVLNKERIQMCNDFLIKHSEISPLERNQSKIEIDIEKDPRYWTDIARIVENLKAMSASIKYIARSVIDIDQSESS